MATVVSSSKAHLAPSPHALLATSPLLRSSRLYVRLALSLLGLGILCRTVRYLLQFPYWGDEGMLAVSFLNRDFLGLTKMLEGHQVAPILFLWGEAAVYRLLGSSEWAMRLLPFLASVGGLLLFWRLARLTLPPRAALFAVGILAVARWPVTMGAVVKPYSFDLFWSLILLVPAVHWLKRPERLGWLALLALLVAPALMGSYPAVFVAGAISAALLPTVWQRGSFTGLGLFIAYNVLMFSTFYGCYQLVGREQLGPETGHVGAFMRTYWADGFPPSEPWELLRWFAAINSGRIMAYPVGDSNGGSILTLLLFVVGGWRLLKEGRDSLLVLCLLPFVLNLLAACMQSYPYGACARLSQHLAPAVCLLAGCGLATLLERYLGPTARRRATFIFCGLLALCGVAQLFIDVARPHRDDEGPWTRKVANEALALAGPNDGLVVVCDPKEEWSLLRWQMLRRGRKVSWNTAVDERQIAGDGRVWLMSLHMRDRPQFDVTPPGLGDLGRWVCVEQARFTLRRGKADDPNEWCRLSCWERAECAKTSAPPVISCWP